MADWECRDCKAKWGQRVFRKRKGVEWTQDWNLVKADNSWEAKMTSIKLDDNGICDKCREAK